MLSYFFHLLYLSSINLLNFGLSPNFGYIEGFQIQNHEEPMFIPTRLATPDNEDESCFLILSNKNSLEVYFIGLIKRKLNR